MSFFAASLARRCTIRAASNGRCSAVAVQRRFMGGGQPISRSMEAELWQGHPKEPEGWETTVYLTYAASAVLLTLVGLAPDTSIKTVSDRLFFIRIRPHSPCNSRNQKGKLTCKSHSFIFFN